MPASHLFKIHFSITLSSHFPTKTMSAPLLSPRVNSAAHLTFLDLITRICPMEYRSLLRCLLHYHCYLVPVPPSTAQQPLVGKCHLIIGCTRSHTPQSVGLLWKSGHPEANTSTGQHTTLTREVIHATVRSEPAIQASEHTHALLLFGYSSLLRPNSVPRSRNTPNGKLKNSVTSNSNHFMSLMS
jgi:hypothetical protein